VTHWKSAEDARDFFNDFAKRQGIDPLRVQDWYSVAAFTYRDQLLPMQTVRAALQKAYPELEFKRWQTRYKPFLLRNAGINLFLTSNWYSRRKRKSSEQATTVAT